MFFAGWSPIVRVLVLTPIFYAALVALLRVTGNRTLAKMNAFDFIMTIALGSTFASAVLSKDVRLAEGIVAFAVIVGLQYVVAFVSVRSERFRALVQAEPKLLVHRGRWLRDAMRASRVTGADVFAALRSEGVARIEDVEALVLETDGTFSVVRGRVDPNTLEHVTTADG